MIRLTPCQRCGLQTICGEFCATCHFAQVEDGISTDAQYGVSLSRFLETRPPPAPTIKQRPLTPDERRKRFRTIVGGKA